MAVATGTALLIGAGVSAATSAGLSFSQASKQRKIQKQAEREADEAMADARNRLGVNFAEDQSIKKEAYELEREANLVAGASATEAGVASERGAAATAGRVYAAQQQGQGQVRAAMGDEMTNIENSIIEEDSRLRDLNVGLDLEEVAGNQQRAALAEARAEQSKQQGIQSAIKLGTMAIQYGLPLGTNGAADLLPPGGAAGAGGAAAPATFGGVTAGQTGMGSGFTPTMPSLSQGLQGQGYQGFGAGAMPNYAAQFAQANPPMQFPPINFGGQGDNQFSNFQIPPMQPLYNPSQQFNPFRSY
tara:strand:- start:1214 stop:2119 length:906 start_codon:yes stop_codon:yes gene_type:complete